MPFRSTPKAVASTLSVSSKNSSSEGEEAAEPVVIDEEDLTLSGWSCTSPTCLGCNVKFSMMGPRRHHCRMCGKSYCDPCAPKNCYTSVLSETHRICNSCYHAAQRKSETLLQREQVFSDEEEEPELNLPTVEKGKQSHIVRLQRTTKLGSMLLPILSSYRGSQKRVATLRKSTKNDEDFEMARRQLMDEQHAKEAPNMKNVLVSMGGLYNKGAQLAASQQMIMPPRLIEELKSCFEDMPFRKWDKMEKEIIKCLGSGNKKVGQDRMKEEFHSIESQPLAAASIGQVHCGKLKTGERVVVKILYPEIRRNMMSDLATMKTSIQLIVSMLGLNDMKSMIEIFYNELADNFPRELDFHVELAHMDYARQLLARHSPDILVPKAYAALSGTQLLTQEMVQGETLNKIGAQKDPARMAQGQMALNKVIDAMGNMIFKDGFFHADPHPGNIMVLPDGRPAMIDWGQCMNLSKIQRRRLCQMVMLLRTRNIDLIITGLNASGFQFPVDKSGTTAAIIFFFFDSAVKSPFTKDIDEFGANLRTSPGGLALPTEMPREVIFFARVMQCLRRDCELMGLDISAIDRWTPIARSALRSMVYDTIPRNPKSKEEERKEKGEEDDSSIWSPSRLLLMIDTSKFDSLEAGIKYTQANPEVGDAAQTWACEALNGSSQKPKELLELAVKHKALVSMFIKVATQYPEVLLGVIGLFLLFALRGFLRVFLF